VRFHNIKTVLQLQMGFIVVLSLMLAAMLVIHIAMLDSFNVLTSIINEDDQKLQVVSQLRDIVSKEAIDLRDSIILSERPEIEEKIEILNRQRQEFQDTKMLLGKFYNTDENGMLYKKIVDIYLSMEPVIHKITLLATENNDKEALHILISEHLPLQKELIDTLNVLNIRIKAKQARDLQSEAALYVMRIKIELLLGGIFTVFCILFAIRIRTIMKRQAISLKSE
jgi:hypothetical protein